MHKILLAIGRTIAGSPKLLAGLISTVVGVIVAFIAGY